MVPYAKSAVIPLLPFEWQLINALGITEEEYRHFSAQVELKLRRQPASDAYENVPDIVNGPVAAIVVSVVVGIASTAAAIALRPRVSAPTINIKPSAATDPGKEKGVGERRLSDSTGSDRFSPTYGFDSIAELANYGEPIPIVFGKYDELYRTGGILMTPRLVWSRMFSYGTQQAIKMLFVVGEQGRDAGQVPQGIDPPNLQGIFIGNGSLDSANNSQYAFYWKRNTTVSGFTRVKAINLLYGSRGSLAAGDPENYDDVYSCPTSISENDTGFSSVHSLSNNAQFGCFAAIANGTDYRVNWRIISKLGAPAANLGDGADQLRMERTKIAGVLGYEVERTKDISDIEFFAIGQAGTGRGYSRRMGIVSINNSGPSGGLGRDIRYVAVGDKAKFVIAGNQIPSDYYYYKKARVRVDDINSTLNQERIAADDALQIGETFMIARSLWKVVNRSIAIWRPEDNRDQVIDLECIEILGGDPSNQVGIVSEEMLRRDVLSDDLGVTNGLHAGGAWYPLMQYALGLVRNTRACDVTEIGIRSRVYQRLNGICNFQSLPTAFELKDYENNNINVTSGTANQYIQRSSFFTIQLRPSGLDSDGNEYAWALLGEQFVVSGNSPIDQYNFIRFKHPEKRQYEYRFIPKNGADMRISPDSAKFIRLNNGGSTGNAAERQIFSRDYTTAYGVFRVYAAGEEVEKAPLQSNAEFMLQPEFVAANTQRTYPESVSVYTFLPDDNDQREKMTQNVWIGPFGVPDFTVGRMGAFREELFGVADNSYDGIQVREFRFDSSWGITGNRWFVERITYGRVRASNNYHGRQFTWDIYDRQVVNSSFGWNINSDFIVSRTLSPGNPWRNVPGQGTMTVAGERRRVVGTTTAEYSIGRSQGFYEEIFGPARNLNFGETRSQGLTGIIRWIDGAAKRITLTISSTVYYEPNHWTGVTKLWSSPTYTVVQSPSSTDTDWNPGEQFDITYTVSGDNPFRQAGTLVGARFSIDSVVTETTDKAGFTGNRIFEFQSQYADVSFYGDLVEKSNKSAPEHSIAYVNEIVANEYQPNYDRMTIAGIVLKASKNFTTMDQPRFWLRSGVPVTNLHPDDGGLVQPSNLFTDLVFYLLTNATAGVGQSVGMNADYAPLVDIDEMAQASRFLRRNRLFYDGVISSPVNVRQFISQVAPYMLLDFVLKDGKFSLRPAIPVNSGGDISTDPVTIKQIFTSGNIIENSFAIDYLPAEERKPFSAIVRYRQETENQLPQEKTLSVRLKTDSDFTPVESFDLTDYCTSRHHAMLVARYFLSVRKNVTHNVSFKTTPYGMDLAPGDYVRVITEASPYSSAQNGVIDEEGNITSATEVTDGSYSIYYYKQGSDDMQEATMEVLGGVVTNSALYDSLFTISNASVSSNIYMIEQLTVDQDGTVEISAVEFPCDQFFRSRIADDLLNDGLYLIEG